MIAEKQASVEYEVKYLSIESGIAGSVRIMPSFNAVFRIILGNGWQNTEDVL
jgi:hypothetical protein